MELSWNCHGTIRELAGNQSISISSPVLHHLYASLDAELLCSNFGQNYGIVLAEIKQKFSAPYCVMITCSVPRQFQTLSRHFQVTFK